MYNIKLFDKIVGKTFSDLGFGLYLMLKSLRHDIKKTQSIKKLEIIYPNKWLRAIIYKELSKLNTKKTNNPIKNEQKTSENKLYQWQINTEKAT